MSHAQFTGQPAVLYYAPLLFKRLGIPGDLAADMATIGLGVAKFISILVCVLTVDRVGRRRYLLLGTFVMTGALTLVGVVAIATPAIVALHKTTPPVCGLSSVVNDSTGMNVSVNVTTAPMSEGGVPIVSVIAVVIGLLFFITGYELSYGPVTWIVLGEIFPAEIRGRAISITTSLNWLANIVIAVSMLSLLDALHGYSYILYAFFTFVGFVFILLMVPETKGKSLEQLSRELSVRLVYCG
jgi:MFS family permease